MKAGAKEMLRDAIQIDFFGKPAELVSCVSIIIVSGYCFIQMVLNQML